MALSVHDDDARTAALELLCSVAEKPFVAVDSILEIVLPALAMLAEDGAFKIRRSVVLGCLQVAEAVLVDADVDSPLEIALCQPVARMFLSLCQDQVWSVRQACAQSFHRIMTLVIRNPETGDLLALLDRFDSMLSDVSEWVRRRAHADLAEVLIQLDTLDSTPGHERYFEKWVRRFADVCASASTEEETQETLAAQLAKVVDLLGPDEWDHLRHAFRLMAKAPSWRVRAAIAAAVPTLSGLLDTQAVTEDVMPVAEALLLDGHLAVRAPVIEGFMDVLGALGHRAREELIRAVGRCFSPENAPTTLQDGVTAAAQSPSGTMTPTGAVAAARRSDEACGAWRLRLSLASQLDRIAVNCNPYASGSDVLWPLIKLLVRDPVSAVRSEAALKMGPVLGVLCGVSAPRISLAESEGPQDLSAGPSTSSSVDVSRRNSFRDRKHDPLRPRPEAAATAKATSSSPKEQQSTATGLAARSPSRPPRDPGGGKMMSPSPKPAPLSAASSPAGPGPVRRARSIGTAPAHLVTTPSNPHSTHTPTPPPAAAATGTTTASARPPLKRGGSSEFRN